ncbi:flagellar rod assembly protein/muramidase FlgJ [Thioflavicoccus mobilis 8321]|uniref:Peptidoglycan hydrolase FlgJ n=1 Tax=Thioflavicoccus mobilis 8321 TaxID=765912 RepID=L0H288_9GAMM|nr:flagellar assembly peptidoglycan hydrolase FlgJ [Thioflavicoccus mobilis]AGA92157.1 flagellar rod assembly protein/muramidase FlgJ [Thioflavicoccus mobilis 8321]
MIDEQQASRIYTDFQGFNTLRAGAREGSREALEVAAKQFEAYLVQQLLRASREANPDSDVLGGKSSGVYEDMFDKQMALSVTAGEGLGLADLLIRQLGGSIEDASTAALAGSESQANKDGAGAVPVRSVSQAANASAAIAQTPSANPLAAAEEGVSAGVPSAPVASQSGTPLVGVGAVAPAQRTPVRFANADEFVAAVMPHAIEVGAELGADPRLLVAQAALETGWGRSIIRNGDGTSSHNLFNIKAHRSWDGPVASVHTREFMRGSEVTVQAEFRSYDSFADSFRDYVDFLRSNPRYRTALTRTQDPEAFARSLQNAGYATDPAYADKIMQIYGSERLSGAVA